MQIIIRSALAILLGFMFTQTVVAADNKSVVEQGQVKNFQPGYYTLIKGTSSLCGEGMFELNEDKTALTMGAKHSIRVLVGTHVDPCADSEVKDCFEVDEVKYEFKGDQTVASVVYTLKHKEKVVNTDSQSYLIRKGLIKLDAVEKGENNDSYSCTWKYLRKSL